MNIFPQKGAKSTDLSLAGLVITLGIVYGDLGTSPLYTMNAIMTHSTIATPPFILGALSAIFWTLTLQTTFKYIFITLRANNRGEGGIFLLLTLLKKRKRWAYWIAMIGACALIGDGIITPAVTVTSAIEGIKPFFPSINVPLVVIAILTILFFSQQYGTASLGSYFGPIMFLWFSMLGVVGVWGIMKYPAVVEAINPIYAYQFLVDSPHILAILGAVFLCTTGAEALYSDLGHCGLNNVRISWIFVKTTLLLSYFGQGAWVLTHGMSGGNPFFAIMPAWFLPYGVVLATLAAIIASQALITGSFTIVSEAISLKLFPNIKVNYPSHEKGQMYIPFINKLLWIGCVSVVLFFQKSSAMESAYGLSIALAMLMTSILLVNYIANQYALWKALLLGALFFTIEATFLLANLSKFWEGGWVSLLICVVLISIMYIWSGGQKMVRNFTTFVNINKYETILRDLSQDEEVPLYASHLVFLTESTHTTRIENQLFYSILRNRPKKADHYWFLHVSVSDDPWNLSYKLTTLIPGHLTRIDMTIGFKIEPKVNLYFQQILFDMVEKREICLRSRYESLNKHDIISDFRFILIERTPNSDYDFSPSNRFVLNSYFWMKQRLVNTIKAFGFDPTRSRVEYIPLMNSEEIFYQKHLTDFELRLKSTHYPRIKRQPPTY